MVFALLVPAAAYGARYGWKMASDATLAGHERVLGWSIAALSVAGMVACLVMLARVTEHRPCPRQVCQAPGMRLSLSAIG